MMGFHDTGTDLPEEFDWFSEMVQDGDGCIDYLNIADLRESVEPPVQQEVSVQLDPAEFVCGDIEEDENMWKYCEKLTDAAEGVFSAIYEKLCGRQMPECAGTPARYVEQMGKRCEVVQTELGDSAAGRRADAVTARLQSCFSERGCVAAMVSDAQWRQLIGAPDSPFADSGVRTLQIIGMKNSHIIVNDFANSEGRSLEIQKGAFCALYGILIEVYK